MVAFLCWRCGAAPSPSFSTGIHGKEYEPPPLLGHPVKLALIPPRLVRMSGQIHPDELPAIPLHPFLFYLPSSAQEHRRQCHIAPRTPPCSTTPLGGRIHLPP
ncbi:hypothetical protein VPH35_007595 [Triticum aestivum]